MVGADQRDAGGTLQLQATYAYDAFGQRVQKVVSSGGSTTTARFGYDGGNVWADLDGSSSLTTRRLYLDGVDAAFARISADGTAAWYATDRQGSVRHLLSVAGTLQATYSYDGFGQVTVVSETAGWGDRYKYTGREQDSETGLQYNRWRYYDAFTGRWTSEDPLRFRAGDANLNRYVGNAPTSYADPSGLFNMKGAWQLLPEEYQRRYWELARAGWSIALNDKGTATTVSPNQDRSNWVDVTNSDWKKRRARGDDVEWRHDEWGIDRTNKRIYIDANHDDVAAFFLRHVIDRIDSCDPSNPVPGSRFDYILANVKAIDPLVYEWWVLRKGIIEERITSGGLFTPGRAFRPNKDAEMDEGVQGGPRPKVILDRDYDEIRAAIALVHLVRSNSSIRNDFYDWATTSRPQIVPEEQQRRMAQWLKDAAAAASTGAQFVLAAYTYQIKGLELVLIANDIANGEVNLGTGLMAMPWLAKGGGFLLKKGAKVVIKDKAGKVLATKTADELHALRVPQRQGPVPSPCGNGWIDPRTGARVNAPAARNAFHWSDAQLQAAVDSIYNAAFSANGVTGVPISVTVTPGGRVVVSQARQVPSVAARARAIEIFGENVEFVRGTTGSNAPGLAGNHAEARAIHYLGTEARGARQATTHYACPPCEARQNAAGVINITGTQSQHGQITRSIGGN
jgi:RHS repeat-associated protein